MMRHGTDNGSKNERCEHREFVVSCECGSEITIRPRPRAGDSKPVLLTGLECPMDSAPYKFLSPLEESIVRLLCVQGPMTGDEIAKDLGESPTGRIRFLLANLVQRLILTGGNGGYNINVPPGEDRAEFCASLVATLDALQGKQGVDNSTNDGNAG